MQATRKARLESVILEELTQLIRGLKDPRIPIMTITQINLTDDARQVTVFVALFGGGQDPEDDDLRMKDAIEGLTSASGFLRRKIAGVLQVRHIPNFIFKADRGLENTLRVHQLLNELKRDGDSPTPDPSIEESDEEEEE